MIKKFYIFENTLYSNLNDNIKDYDEIVKLIGFNTNDYELTINDWGMNELTLSFKESFLIKELDLENGIITWCLNSISTYNRYDSYVDDSEMDFIDRYLDGENNDKLEILLSYLDIDINDEITSHVFDVLDQFIDISDLKMEISEQFSNATIYNIKEAFEGLPFKFDYSDISNFDVDIKFNIEKIGNYIQKNNLEVNTIKEFLQQVDFSDISYQLDNHYETGYNYDYSGINKYFKKYIDKILNLIDVPKKHNDKQLKIFREDEYSKLINKSYNFDNDLFRNIGIEKLNSARGAGGKLFAWFESYPFQKNYMTSYNDPKLEKYKVLKIQKIIHPKIEEEYDYLEYAEKYNI